MDKKPARTKVKVVVRLRPPLNPSASTCVTVTRDKVQIVNHRNKDENLQYEFTSVYNEKASQSDIFKDCVEPLVSSTLQGQNVSIFAYGPTGAGKTHTMLGIESDPGIVPRVIKSLFKTLTDEQETSKHLSEGRPQHTVTFSYLEIYNEKVQDLLLSGNQDLPIREDAAHNIFVAGLTEKTIDSFETFKSQFEPAASNRTVAATKLNEHSSRSHSILLLKVNRRVKNKTYQGKIYLIDLAGSEDNRRTGNKGIRLKESGAINKSLFVLGEVVDAINHNLPRVPYRNSKLTRLLQDSIGGSCESVMITNIAPEQHYYYDTYCTLNFATKSKKIVNVNVKNVKEDSPPAIAKPMAAVKPTKRRSSLIPVVDNKRPRTSLSSSCAAETSASFSSIPFTELATLPSPLLRHQKQLESTVQQKLREMERVIEDLKKSAIVKKNAVSNNQTDEDKTTPSLPSLDKPHKTRRSMIFADYGSSPDVICPTPEVNRHTSKLTDKTNVLAHQHLVGMREKTKKQKPKRTDDGPSCSPLFLDSPAQKKKPAKRSSSDFEPTPPRKKIKKAASRFNNPEQFQRNSDFLQMLNSASVKELQLLQTVGVKRAKAIYDWRELHGPFNFIDSLKEIPGFTDKYLKNLLRSNLVSEAQNV